MNQDERLDFLIDYLLHENPNAKEKGTYAEVDSIEKKIALFRGLCNVRHPEPVTEQFIRIQDAFLTEWNNKRALTKIDDLKPMQPQLFVWQGDITTLAVDAIVNAANSEFLGCLIPNHNCIDNIIHTRAGVQLRLDCDALIREQGRKEAIGKAKITKAYNLPSDHIIHTVGPFIDKRGVSPMKEKLLASSYRSSLALADAQELGTIAFCCISTGEFNFPNEHAADVAIQTVKKYIAHTGSSINVIFNVFKDEDLQIYHSLLETKE